MLQASLARGETPDNESGTVLNYNVKEANFIVIQYYNTTKNALEIYLIVLMIQEGFTA